ncbi:hypothetical protein HII13_002626 [Brettanomyces bruxellensis]|nr:hypothetical protein HII13_002626 [Brettanomyces bruxellensis]
MNYASTWASFIASIASYNGDLSSLTAPPFILSPKSLLEYSQYWGTNTELLLAPNTIKDDDGKKRKSSIHLRRLLAVIKWYLATINSQYASRTDSKHSEKKPLNPFLGEVFVAKFADDTQDHRLGETKLVLEQVQHHPPISAYAVWNEKQNTLLEGYSGVRAFMSATSLNVRQHGHALLHYRNLGEDYLITLPPLHLEGLIKGSPTVELDQKSYIQSSSKYCAVFEYSGRGYFSGKKKRFFDSSKAVAQKLIVKPISEQHELESRRAWKKVADSIVQGDYKLITKEKSQIENEQRELRKKEEAKGVTWTRRWYDEIDYSAKDHTDKAGMKLFKMAHLSMKNVPSGILEGSSKEKSSKTMKHWRFNLEKFNAEKDIKC